MYSAPTLTLGGNVVRETRSGVTKNPKEISSQSKRFDLSGSVGFNL